jgi:hypothetical protein
MAMLRHAARGLIKSGNAATLAVFGHGAARIAPAVPVLASQAVRMGEALGFSVTLAARSGEEQRLAVDYIVHFRKANGTLSPKVFKGWVLTLGPGETRTLRRKHRFRAITTRRHYPGPHALSLRINGQDSQAVGFELMPEA